MSSGGLVEAAMSSGEGAEETTKDAGDIEAFFKTGKEWETKLPLVQLLDGHCFPSVWTSYWLIMKIVCKLPSYA